MSTQHRSGDHYYDYDYPALGYTYPRRGRTGCATDKRYHAAKLPLKGRVLMRHGIFYLILAPAR